MARGGSRANSVSPYQDGATRVRTRCGEHVCAGLIDSVYLVNAVVALGSGLRLGFSARCGDIRDERMKRTKVAIIGVGLLGGSVALALKRHGGFEVVGWNHRATSRRRASKLLKVAPSLESAVRDASVVVLGAHSNAVCDLLRTILPWLAKDALVLDVSSLKGRLAEEAAKIAGLAGRFVPSHPMAGKEKSGPEAAEADLFKGRYVFVTPVPNTPKKNVRRAEKFWRLMGAKVLRWTPRDHDRRVAVTSHLPHLLACVMVELYGQRLSKDAALPAAVGTGFKDFSRIAAGHPVMWADILDLNRREIGQALRAYRNRLQSLEQDLEQGRHAKWVRFFSNAQDLRERL
jgi:prephenate dehydrogenase